MCHIATQNADLMFHASNESSESDSDVSFDSPPFSPLSAASLSTPSGSQINLLFDETDEEKISNVQVPSTGSTEFPELIFSEMPSTTDPRLSPAEFSAAEMPYMPAAEMPAEMPVAEMPAEMPVAEMPAAEMPATVAIESCTNFQALCQSGWFGFKIVGDNLDRNFRRSFKRHGKKTISMHAFHMYAVKDRIDFSSYSDIAPANAQVDVTKLLIGKTQLDKLNKDVMVLLSR